MMMPSEVNGNDPLNWLSKSVMSCCSLKDPCRAVGAVLPVVAGM